MSLRTTLSAYVPDREPTWTDVAVAVLVVLGILAPTFHSPSTVSWPAVALGFVAFAVALGPGAHSSIGTSVGAWFRDIGVAGRATVIVLFATGVAVAFQASAVPNAVLADVGAGGLVAVILFTSVHVVVAGGIAGWTPERERDE